MTRERTYTIAFTRSSEKQYRDLPNKVQSEVALILEDIARDPLLGKPLQGPLKGLRSKRVGRFRIVYQQNRKELLVIIINIDHRKKVYRKK